MFSSISICHVVTSSTAKPPHPLDGPVYLHWPCLQSPAPFLAYTWAALMNNLVGESKFPLLKATEETLNGGWGKLEPVKFIGHHKKEARRGPRRRGFDDCWIASIITSSAPQGTTRDRKHSPGWLLYVTTNATGPSAMTLRAANPIIRKGEM